MLKNIYNNSVTIGSSSKMGWDNKLDDILTSKFTGFISGVTVFSLLITIAGANYPSEALAFSLLDRG